MLSDDYFAVFTNSIFLKDFKISNFILESFDNHLHLQINNKLDKLTMIQIKTPRVKKMI